VTDHALPLHGSPTVRTGAEAKSEPRPQAGSAAAGKGPRKLTVRLLESLGVGDRVRDTTVRGLFAECGQRGVSLKLQADLRQPGRPVCTVRMTLGKYPELGLDEARVRAMGLLVEIRAGRDPRAERAPAAQLTVSVAVDRYLDDMATRECAPKCISYTGARLRNHLAAWSEIPLIEILPTQCQAEHARIKKESGHVAANKTLRDFRAVWNLALRKADSPDAFPRRCPVASVTFYREGRREDAVITDLPGWWKRVQDLGNPLRVCMHQLGLLAGLRPGNLVGIRREWIDLPGKVIRFPAEVMKGRAGKRRPFSLPLSAPMVAVVQRALELGDGSLTSGKHGGWLFPTRTRDGRDVIATANWTESTLEMNECGHALRHSFKTLGAAAGVAGGDVELLMAHTVRGVEGVYLHAEHGPLLEHLREQQERISAFILGRLAPAPPA
jgi:integrase